MNSLTKHTTRISKLIAIIAIGFATIVLSEKGHAQAIVNTSSSSGITNGSGATLDFGTAIFSNSGTFTNSGTLRTTNTSTTPVPVAQTWAGSVVYYGAASTVVAGTYSNLTILAATSLGGNITVNGVLTLDANLTLGSYNIILGPSATIVSTVGTFSATNMIVIGGSGTVTKQGTIGSQFVTNYPIGIGSIYAGVKINSLSVTTITGTATFTISTTSLAASGVPGTGLKRYWTTATTNMSGSILADISFAYDAASDVPSGYSASSFDIIYKPVLAAEWAIPSGASAAGANPLSASSATTLNATWSAAKLNKRTFYTLLSGDWDNHLIWTLDPSGSQYNNPDNLTPSTSVTSGVDDVVILSGRTVTVSANGKTNNNLTVTGTLDFGSTSSHSFLSINGSGKIRLSLDDFPTGDATRFITKGQDEGTVEYYGNSFSLSTAHSFFNMNVNMTSGQVLTLLNNYNLAGNLKVINGTFSINNDVSATALTLKVMGNITVASSGIIATGKGNARHQIDLYGNFTNNGTASFTNRTVADYTTEAADGIVDVNFLCENADQNVFCNGVTNFYRIEINKGSDNTYVLKLDASNPSYFNLLGYANESHTLGSTLTDNNNALGLISGSVKVGNDVTIPYLSGAANYVIPSAATLWVDGGTVKKNAGTMLAVYGSVKVSDGTLETKISDGISLYNNGILNVSGGTVNTNQIKTAAGSYIQSDGTVNVLAGTTNTAYYPFSLSATTTVFNMSGGTLNVFPTSVGGIFINSSSDNVQVTGGTVVCETNGTIDFTIASTAPFWNLELKNSSSSSRNVDLVGGTSGGVTLAAQALYVLNDFRIWGQESGGSTYPALTFRPVTSATNINNVYIGGSFYIEKGATYLPVFGGTAPYSTIATQPANVNTTYFNQTDGTSGIDTLYYGRIDTTLEIGNFVLNRTHGNELRMASASGRTNASTMMDINGTSTVTSGTFSQELYTVRLYGSVTNYDQIGTWVLGTTPSGAQIQFVDNASFTITTGEDAVFGNVQINATSNITLSSDVYIQRLELKKGPIYLKTYNLKVDDLWNLNSGLFVNSATNSYMNVANTGMSGSSIIYTDGNASDGGLSLKVSANSAIENQNNILNNLGPLTFPIGFVNSGTTYFRPAQMVVKGFSDDGYVTIRPVKGSLQLTNTSGGEVLQHYWNVSYSSFTNKPTVAYRFYYRNQSVSGVADLPTGATGEATYVPGKVIDADPFTRSYEVNSDLLRNIGSDNNTRIITFNGTSTGGTFSPSSTGFTLEDANYTTGLTARFTGSVLIYYTRDFGTGNGTVSASTTVPYTSGYPNWTDNNTWTRSDILISTYDPHDSRQPAVTSGQYPGAGDVAEIGFVPWTDAQKSTIQGQPHGVIIFGANASVAELIFKPMTDVSGNRVARIYRSNFQFRPTLLINTTYSLTAQIVKGEGLFWNRYSTPDFTAMDVGDFAREDSSYILYETNGTGTTTTISNAPSLYPNLMISSRNWGANNNSVIFTQDIKTTGNVEILGNSNILLNTGTTGDFTIGRDLYMFEQTWSGNASGGGAELRFQNSGTARTVNIGRDLIMANASSQIDVFAGGSVIDHELHIQGNIVQGTSTKAATGLSLSATARATLYLDGAKSMVYNLVNGTTPSLYRLVVDKGSSIDSTAYFGCNFTLSGSTSGTTKALELNNGLFIVNNSSVSLNLTTGGSNFSIPSTAGLEMRAGTAYANGTSGIALDGLLRLSGGSLDMRGGDNPIIYSSSGNAKIEISSAASYLYVGGQIRRSENSSTGILQYKQTLGEVYVGTNIAGVASRGVFEILNTGSAFNMTGGNLYICRQQLGTPTISSFYFNPDTVNIGTAANIYIGSTSATYTPASQTIGIYAGKELPKLTINGTSSPIAMLEVVPATISNLLQVNSGATLNTNGLNLTLNGNLTCSGTFVPDTGTVYFSGSVGHTVTGRSATDTLKFYNLEVGESDNLTLASVVTDIAVSNSCIFNGGTITDNSNDIYIKGYLQNDATHVYGGSGDGITLCGTSSQTLTGNGTFGKLSLNNISGFEVPVGNQFTITNSLKMKSGVLYIGRNLLTLASGAIIEQASPFSATNMVETNISFTDNGLKKTFPTISSSTQFIYPMGSSGKYTPVTFNITANGTSGSSITVKPADEVHPSVSDSTNALQYYWTLRPSGITGFTGTALMKYDAADVAVTGANTINNYIAARLRVKAADWDKYNTTYVDPTNSLLTFKFNGATDDTIFADYTAGIKSTFVKVDTFTAISSTAWATTTTWNPNSTGTKGPDGAVAIIPSGFSVNANANGIFGYATEIKGTLNLNITNSHRLGIIKGTGLMQLESGNMPAGVFDDFFSETGGTIEFGGTSTYEVLGNFTTVNNITFTGSADKRLPNNDLTALGNFVINGNAGLGVVNYYNRNVTIKDSLILSSGTFDGGSGNASVIMAGTLTQFIKGDFSGNNAFNILTTKNTNGVTLLGDVDINKQLKFTTGKIIPGSYDLRIKYSGTVSPSTGSTTKFVDGPLIKELMTGNSFIFPVGNENSNLGTIALSGISGTSGIKDWKVTYKYSTPNVIGSTSSFKAPIQSVSNGEYWHIEAPSGGKSKITIYLDGSNDIANANSSALSKLRIVGWNPSTSQWEVVGTKSVVSGTSGSGTISTTTAVSYGTYSYFTIGCIVLPSIGSANFTSTPTTICNGTSIDLNVYLTGTSPWVVTYTDGTSTYTSPSVTSAANSATYTFSVNPTSTKTYTLLSVTSAGVAGSIGTPASVKITVASRPTVSFSSTQGTTAYCPGANTFTATAGYSIYNFRVNGISAQNSTANTYSSSTLTGTQSVDVIVTNTSNCTTTSSAIINTVYVKPADAGTITGLTSVCSGANGVVYTVPAISGVTSYVWTLPSGASGTSTTNSITVNFGTSTGGIISVYGTNSTNASGCQSGASSSVTVSVSALGALGATGSFTAGAPTICRLDSANYTISTSANAAGYIWYYSGSGATIGGTNTSVTSAGTTTTSNTINLKLSASATSGALTVSPYGCTTGAASSAYTITVYTLPTATISPLFPSTCEGVSLGLTGATTNGSGTSFTSQTWSGAGAGFLNTTSGSNVTFSTTTGGGSSYDVIYTITDNLGCKSSNTVSLTVYDAPVANAGIDLTSCSGTTNITMTGASASGSYLGTPSWSGSGGTWSNASNPANAIFQPATASGTTTATLTLTGANGCSTVTGTRTITWGTTPTITLTSTSISACYNSAVAANGAYTYSAVTGGANLYSIDFASGLSDITNATLSGGSISITIPAGTAAGTYTGTLTVSNSAGCISSGYTVYVYINALPNISTQPSASVQNICLGGTATSLSVAATAGSGTISGYQWYSNGSPSNSGGTAVAGTLASYMPLTTSAGTLYYYCVVTNTNACAATSNVSGAITITALPTVEAGADQTTCDGVNLSISGASAADYSALQWIVDSGCPTCSLTDDATTAPTFIPVATGANYPVVLRFTVTGAGGCSAVSVSDTKTVNVNATPTTGTISHD